MRLLHLGRNVSAIVDDDTLTITLSTDDGNGTTNTIVLTPEMMTVLLDDALADLRQEPAKDSTGA